MATLLKLLYAVARTLLFVLPVALVRVAEQGCPPRGHPLILSCRSARSVRRAVPCTVPSAVRSGSEPVNQWQVPFPAARVARTPYHLRAAAGCFIPPLLDAQSGHETTASRSPLRRSGTGRV